MAFATATGVDLGLDDPKRAIKFACGGLGLFGLHDNAAIRDRNAIGPQKRLGLIFVDVHRSSLGCSKFIA